MENMNVSENNTAVESSENTAENPVKELTVAEMKADSALMALVEQLSTGLRPEQWKFVKGQVAFRRREPSQNAEPTPYGLKLFQNVLPGAEVTLKFSPESGIENGLYNVIARESARGRADKDGKGGGFVSLTLQNTVGVKESIILTKKDHGHLVTYCHATRQSKES